MATFTPNLPIVTDTPTIDVEGLTPGQHRFQLVAEDEAGNRSQPATAIVTVETPIPRIIALVPSFGQRGDQIVIQGKYFDPDPPKNRVVFNSIPAQVLSSTDTELMVRIPQPATTGPVAVQTHVGTGVSPTPFVIPISFTVGVGPQPTDLAYDPVKDEVWVVNSGPAEGNRGSVSIVSLAERRVLATLLVGVAPMEIALSPPGGRRLGLVTNSGDGTVSVIRMDERQVISNIQVGANPLGVAISPDGRWGYVVTGGDATTAPGVVSVIDLIELRLTTRIRVGRAPTRVVFSHDGREAFVNNTGEGSISVVKVSSHQVSDTVEVGPGAGSSPQEVALSLETYPCWTANQGVRSSSAITRERTVVNAPLGIAPTAVATVRRGNRVFLAGPDDAVLIAITLEGDQPPKIRETPTKGLGGQAGSVALMPNDLGVILTHPRNNAVSIFESRSLMLRAVVEVPPQPLRCLVTSDNKFACIVCGRGRTLAVLEIESVLP